MYFNEEVSNVSIEAMTVLILPLRKCYNTCWNIPAKIQRAILAIRMLKLTCKKDHASSEEINSRDGAQGLTGSWCSYERSTQTWQQKGFREASMLIIQCLFYAIHQVRHQLQAVLPNRLRHHLQFHKGYCSYTTAGCKTLPCWECHLHTTMRKTTCAL